MERHPGSGRRGASRVSSMSALALALALTIVIAVATPVVVRAPAGALAGGRQTPEGTFPWTVSIGPPSSCTGALIAPTWVLTAAHCAVTSADPVVRVGSWSVNSGGQEIDVVAQHVHPDYDPPPGGMMPEFLLNDIMLMELAEPVALGVIPLGRADQSVAWEPGAVARVAGFGISCGFFIYGDPPCDGVDVEAMHDGPIPVAEPQQCVDGYPQETFDVAIALCVSDPSGAVTPCFGDSGASLLATTPEGLVTAGVVSGGGTPCGDPQQPAVFTRVSAFLDWIADVSGVQPPPVPPPSTTTTTSTVSTSSTTSPDVVEPVGVAVAVTVTPAFTG